MRVARILLGIVLVAISVLGLLGGGALWIAMQHASSDGGFGGAVTGLSTSGNAIVVPNINTLLRTEASLTGRAGTSVSIDAMTSTGPAFIGIAPIGAVQAYLGPAPYARVASLHTGLGGIPVTLSEVPGLAPGTSPGASTGAKPAAIPGGAPSAQGFWAATSSGGRLQWAPSNQRYDGLALVIMRADAAGPVAVTAHAEVKPDWLASATWALLSVGTVVAIIAIALLLWPSRRREIVYVVEPTQLPEIAERLGVTMSSLQTAQIPASQIPASQISASRAAAGLRAAGGLGVETAPAAEAAAAGARTATRSPAGSGSATAVAGPANGRFGGEVGVDALVADAVPAPRTYHVDGVNPGWAAPTPGPMAPVASARASVPVGNRATIPAVFADPLTRPNSLRTAMLLNANAAQPGMNPTPTNERGTYRAFGTPPPVTPAFLWQDQV